MSRCSVFRADWCTFGGAVSRCWGLLAFTLCCFRLADCQEALDTELTAAVGAIDSGPALQTVKGSSNVSITPGSSYSHVINVAKEEYKAERDVTKLESIKAQFEIPEDKADAFQMPGWRASLKRVSNADPNALASGEAGGNLDAVKSTAK